MQPASNRIVIANYRASFAMFPIALGLLADGSALVVMRSICSRSLLRYQRFGDVCTPRASCAVFVELPVRWSWTMTAARLQFSLLRVLTRLRNQTM
jgi:hypothetical protein